MCGLGAKQQWLSAALLRGRLRHKSQVSVTWNECFSPAHTLTHIHNVLYIHSCSNSLPGGGQKLLIRPALMSRQDSYVRLITSCLFFSIISFCCSEQWQSRSLLAVTTANTCPNMSQISLKSRFHENRHVHTRLVRHRPTGYTYAVQLSEWIKNWQFKQSFPLLLHNNSANPERKRHFGK